MKKVIKLILNTLLIIGIIFSNVSTILAESSGDNGHSRSYGCYFIDVDENDPQDITEYYRYCGGGGSTSMQVALDSISRVAKNLMADGYQLVHPEIVDMKEEDYYSFPEYHDLISLTNVNGELVWGPIEVIHSKEGRAEASTMNGYLHEGSTGRVVSFVFEGEEDKNYEETIKDSDWYSNYSYIIDKVTNKETILEDRNWSVHRAYTVPTVEGWIADKTELPEETVENSAFLYSTITYTRDPNYVAPEKTTITFVDIDNNSVDLSEYTTEVDDENAPSKAKEIYQQLDGKKFILVDEQFDFNTHDYSKPIKVKHKKHATSSSILVPKESKTYIRKFNFIFNGEEELNYTEEQYGEGRISSSSIIDLVLDTTETVNNNKGKFEEYQVPTIDGWKADITTIPYEELIQDEFVKEYTITYTKDIVKKSILVDTSSLKDDEKVKIKVTYGENTEEIELTNKIVGITTKGYEVLEGVDYKFELLDDNYNLEIEQGEAEIKLVITRISNTDEEEQTTPIENESTPEEDSAKDNNTEENNIKEDGNKTNKDISSNKLVENNNKTTNNVKRIPDTSDDTNMTLVVSCFVISILCCIGVLYIKKTRG